MSARPARKKSALNASAASVIAPAPAPGRAAGGAAHASVASTTGNAGKAGSDGDSGERIVKVTARLGSALAGRCRAAYIDGLLRGGPASFEAWIAEALEEKLAREEERRGRAYEPVGTGRVPRGRR